MSFQQTMSNVLNHLDKKAKASKKDILIPTFRKIVNLKSIQDVVSAFTEGSKPEEVIKHASLQMKISTHYPTPNQKSFTKGALKRGKKLSDNFIFGLLHDKLQTPPLFITVIG